jgi:hypothetical protein
MIEQHGRTDTAAAARRHTERFGVIALALTVVGLVAIYFVINSRRDAGGERDLLPYQTLARDLPAADQEMFRAIRAALLVAEQDFVRTGAWPQPGELAQRGIAPFAAGGPLSYQWSLMRQGAIVNYLAQPANAAAPAWLLEIQEPEAGMLPDTAPADEEHHKLSTGMMIHTYVWTHPYGSQVPIGFVRQPQNSGWTQVFTTPPNAIYYNRR